MVYFEAQDIDRCNAVFRRTQHDGSDDHMGRPDVTKGVDSQEFGKFISLMERNRYLVQSELPRALDSETPRITPTWCRLLKPWLICFQTAYFGAPTGHIKHEITHSRRWS
ncbi:hypothetical protein OK016_28180 [Vibrio chagasii]|nr:hypothetical protein [Vibrio chagasii]